MKNCFVGSNLVVREFEIIDFDWESRGFGEKLYLRDKWDESNDCHNLIKIAILKASEDRTISMHLTNVFNHNNLVKELKHLDFRSLVTDSQHKRTKLCVKSFKTLVIGDRMSDQLDSENFFKNT